MSHIKRYRVYGPDLKYGYFGWSRYMTEEQFLQYVPQDKHIQAIHIVEELSNDEAQRFLAGLDNPNV